MEVIKVWLQTTYYYTPKGSQYRACLDPSSKKIKWVPTPVLRSRFTTKYFVSLEFIICGKSSQEYVPLNSSKKCKDSLIKMFDVIITTWEIYV